MKEQTYFKLMKLRIRASLILCVITGYLTVNTHLSFGKPVLIRNVYATGYYCVYNSQIEGSQTINETISNDNYTLKASFLFGGRGIAMQGSGRTGPAGDYIKYTGGGGFFVRLTGPSAGRNLDGLWIENPDVVRQRYARIGITDFTGFGNLALRYPQKAKFCKTSSFIGSSGHTLTAWKSISIDPDFIPLGQVIEINFKNENNSLNAESQGNFVAEDTGSAIKGKHIEIYLGESEKALEQWTQSGSNRRVDILITPPTVDESL